MKKLFLVDLIATSIIVLIHINILPRYINSQSNVSRIFFLMLLSYYSIRYFIVKNFKS
ncbi:hypothetical protein [Streptobacillus moniliformis]|uniref:Uncharacterized protein n=1 Tax=Streptobacillus moniliformis (strain ATCC 14647 / DSM 12112 / NCTC 10651 / 9901) TaxID=519441 RepID=D1AVY5_STRM9|nr:hypothetical protein [Streptobacillus moniliformis]ACZ01895.1 hypothetical protein Smon_1462 [Streptobacillus moniliformis DSM 12112]SQA12899.1 Uncharacterised protein [Streptobacillus moniliformis]SQA14725.1 Uncharacterised protein [Streptobacillus moniliformis]SQA14726.1 Uncharacterised protein [Streptobacillus moniliformis]